MIGTPLPIEVGRLAKLGRYDLTCPTDPPVGREWRHHAFRQMDPHPVSGIMVARTLPPDGVVPGLPILWREALLIPNGAVVEETVGGFLGRLLNLPGRSVYAADVRDVARALWSLA